MKILVVSRLALVTSAAALVVAACSSDRVVSPVTSSRALPRAISSSVVAGGTPTKGVTQVCVDPASTQSLTIATTSAPTYGNDVVTATRTLAPGACGSAVTRTFDSNTSSPITTATLTVSTSPIAGVVGVTEFVCVPSNPPPGSGPTAICPVSGGVIPDGGSVVASMNANHGSTVTFKFTASAPIATPLFVIGDDQARTDRQVGATVNFWGAQWWKNNFMTGIVDNGVASFKGYASGADNFCGGTWTSRVGNTAPPPATISRFINIIVTSTVTKNGPNIGGDIVEILTIDTQGSGYAPNPGGQAFGIVTKKLCP